MNNGDAERNDYHEIRVDEASDKQASTLKSSMRGSRVNQQLSTQLSVNFDNLDATDEDAITTRSIEITMDNQQNQQNEIPDEQVRPSPSLQSIATPVMRSDKFIEDAFAPLKRSRVSENGDTLGLTTARAKEIFTNDLKETIDEADRQTGSLIMNLIQACYYNFVFKPLSGGLTMILLTINLLCLIAACILKWLNIPYKRGDRLEGGRLIAECILVFIALIILTVLDMEKHTRKKKVYVRLLRRRFVKMLADGFEFSIKRKNGDIFEGLNMIPYRLVFVYRDQKWIKLPHVLLVAGDYVYSHLPAKDLSDNDIKYKQTSKEGFYTLEETPIRSLLMRSFPYLRSSDEKLPLNPKLSFYSSVFAVIGTVSFFLMLLVNGLRMITGFGDNDWVLLLLMQPSYTSLFLLPIGFPSSWLIYNVVVKARLAAVFTVVSDIKRQAQFSKLDSKTKHNPIKISMLRFLRNFVQIFIHKSLEYDSVLALGSVTALCFVNKNGVLADLLYAPEKLLLISTRYGDEEVEMPVSPMDHEGHEFQVENEEEQNEREYDSIQQPLYEDVEIELIDEQHVEVEEEIELQNDYVLSAPDQIERSDHTGTITDPVIEDPSQQEQLSLNMQLVDPEDNYDNNDQPMSPVQSEMSNPYPNYVVLDLMFNRETEDENDVIQFEDPEWQRHINLLKPLGLNFLITGTSKLPDFDSVEGMVDAKSHLWKKYVYLLGKGIGFSDDVLESFSFRKRIHTQRLKKEMSAVIVEYEGAGMQIHSFGHPQLLIDYCSDYWDGNDIKPITPQVREHIIETFIQWEKKRDLYCLALAYKPIDSRYGPLIAEVPEEIINIRDQDMPGSEEEPDSAANIRTEMLFDDAKSKTSAQMFNAMQCGQIFLGMSAFRQQPKTDLPDFIQDLENDSGIRFIFYSSQNTQITKAFGSKLGMETDWNSCISLAEREVNLDESDIRAKLPHGIKDIREHIKNIDNVPLLVNLFSDALPETTTQMISILQENHEVVCCVGSSIAIKNLPCYTQANVCIAVDPASEQHMSQGKVIEEKSGDIQEENDFQEDYSGLFSFPVAFHIRSNPQNEQLIATFPILFHLIKEGRKSVANLKQAITFLMCANLCLFVIQALSQLLFLPSTIFTGVQCLWMMFIIIPLLALALVFNPIEPNIMDTISSKNVLYKWKAIKWLFLNSLRFFLPIPIAFVCYVWTLFSMKPQLFVGWKTIFGTTASNTVYRSEEFLTSVVYAQNITLFVVVVYLVFISIGFIHRVHSLITVRLYNNVVWLIVAPLVIILQFIFSFVACITTQKYLAPRKFPKYPFYAYIIVFVLPPLCIITDELAKIRLRKKYFTNQKRLKLQFGTRLGMYSPR